MRGGDGLPGIGERFVFTDEAEAQAACEWWQKELRIADWDIKCWIRRQENIGREAQAAYVCNQRLKNGWIKLVDPIDYPRDTSWPQDHEKSLVHELIHIQTTSFSPESDDVPYEQATELIAQALIRLRCLAYPEKPWRTQ